MPVDPLWYDAGLSGVMARTTDRWEAVVLEANNLPRVALGIAWKNALRPLGTRLRGVRRRSRAKASAV